MTEGVSTAAASQSSALRRSRARFGFHYSIVGPRSFKTFLFVFIISLALAPAVVLPALGQKTRRKIPPTRPPASARPVTAKILRQRTEKAMGVVCAERSRDALGSMPIDEMQARASLELNHPETLIGTQRAQRLLPFTKELVVEAMRRLADEHKLSLAEVRSATKRVRAVKEVVPDPDLRDNAAVVMSDPRTIRFGTIFLVGLPSDEGMMSVLAHELTHIADGRQNSLRILFYRIGKRAALLTGLRINGQKAEELACDLIGVRVARSFVDRTPNNEPLAQRLARSLEHNCVDDDDTDEEHLSPRSTMRALLALEPLLARDLIGHEEQAFSK
jgi:hypothetical protein